MSGTEASRGVRTKGMRIATPCATQELFVESFHRFCEEKSFFVSTLTMRPVGHESAFSVDLTDGRPMLRGYGVVLDAWPTAENRFGRPGVNIGIHKLTADSQVVFEKLLIARAVATDRRETKAAARTMTRQLWAISAPVMPDVPRPVEGRAATRNLPGLVRTATPAAGVRVALPRQPTPPPIVVIPTIPAIPAATPAPAAPPALAIAGPAPDSTFENEAPTVTADPQKDGISFDTPTATATPMYAAALANERAAAWGNAPVVEREVPIVGSGPTIARGEPSAEAAIDDAWGEPAAATNVREPTPADLGEPPAESSAMQSAPVEGAPPIEPPLDLPPDPPTVRESKPPMPMLARELRDELTPEPPEPPTLPPVEFDAVAARQSPIALAALAEHAAARVRANTPPPIPVVAAAPATIEVAPHIDVPETVSIDAPSSPSIVSVSPVEAPVRPRSWWSNPRVAAVFVGGIAVGFLISLVVRSPSSEAVAPVPAPPAVTAPVVPAKPTAATVEHTAPPPTKPATPPVAKPTAPTKPVTAIAPTKPAPPAHPVAKPVRPAPKPVVRRPIRPKPAPQPAPKPKCVGLACV